MSHNDSEVQLLCVPAVSNSDVYRRLQNCRTLQSHVTVQNYCYLHTQYQAHLYNMLKERYLCSFSNVFILQCFSGIKLLSVKFVYISKPLKLSTYWQNSRSNTRVCGLAWDQISAVQNRSQTSLGFVPRTRYPDCIKTLQCCISTIKSINTLKRGSCTILIKKKIHHIVGGPDVHLNINNKILTNIQ